MKDFEKFFSPPFSYERGRIFIESEVAIQECRDVADIVDPLEFRLSQLRAMKVQDELGVYLTTCANLMPEAIEALRMARETLETIKDSPFCGVCETCDDVNPCKDCKIQIALDKVTAILAKLEEGVDA